MLHHIPNVLSVIRILLVPPLLYLLWRGQYEWALAVFMLTGFTDLLDGYLARRYHWQSTVGSFLDPLADKLLMVPLFVTLAVIELVPLALALLVIGRDVLIIGGLASYRALVGPIEGGASAVSKVNTAMLLLFVLAVIGNAAFAALHPAIVMVLGAIVIVTTIVSGLDYIRAGVVRARAHYLGRRLQ